jgi:hypothetical protein
LGGRYSDAAFEGSGEMALVAKARRQSDLDNWRLSRSQLVTGVFNPQLPHVISDRALVRLVKHLSQMDRMHADVVSHLGQCQVFRESPV